MSGMQRVATAFWVVTGKSNSRTGIFRKSAYTANMKQIKAIISDADGTLVNTVYLIRHGQYEAGVEYMQSRGIPRHDIPSYEVYESFINKAVGGSTRETFERTLRLMFQNHEYHIEKLNFDELDERLGPIQDRIAPLYVHPFHGLTELFTWLGKSKTSLGIFTSGNRRMIVRNFGVSLPVMGYTELFKADEIPVDERLQAFTARAKAVYGMRELATVTCEDVSATKPDPEGILTLVDTLRVTPDEVIVLGDHAVDVQAARAAGLRTIGVSHGFGTPAELIEAGAIRTIDDLAALPKLIELHNSGEAALF
jgi:phosphoglycolate phosphatase-like HAD superfamily hydrolase